MKKNFIFYFLCVLTFILFLGAFLTKTVFKPYILPPYNTMNVILEAKTKTPYDVILKVNDNFLQIPPSKNVLNKEIRGKVKTLDILVKEGFEKEINNIVIFNDIKVHYFKDFSLFEKEKISLCPSGNCSNYTKYKAPVSIKRDKNSAYYNFRSNINLFCSFILNTLSGGAGFLPYILLFVTLIYFIKNEIKISNKIVTFFVFLMACVMYFNGLFDYLPWTDEYRTIEYSDPKNPIISIFSDPGNPALFYFLFRVFISYAGVSTFTMKIFPFIISILAIFSLWMFLKTRFDLKTANFGVFLASINIPLIYYAQETRSYILQAMFTPLIVWSLFNVLEKNRKKDYIIYGALIGIVSNIHYYEILLIISNFVFACVYLLVKKRYKDILKFFGANLIGGAFFLPFFFYTALNDALKDSSFNTWIPNTDFSQIKKCIYYVFGGGTSLLFSIIFFIKNLAEKRNITAIYSLFAVLFTIILGIILSYLIRPMLVERYLVLLCPLIIIFLCSILKNKYGAVFLLVWIIFMQSGSFEKNNRRKGIIEEPLNFSKEYYLEEHPKENIYAIINLTNPEYLENRENYMIEGINYISLSAYEIENKIDEILKKDNNAIIFTSLLAPTKENFKKGENYYCYFNSTTDMCMWKIKS